MTIKITFNYSPNFEDKKRSKKSIKFLIFHYTGMKSEKKAIKRLTDFQSQVASHYLIKTNGDIVVFVPDLYIAWHAGFSSWKNYNFLNKNSIGIEISNPGHEFGYKKFSKKQINSLVKLSSFLIKKYKINKKNILGHSDIAVLRKVDPGEKFPWKLLSKNKIGMWHNINYKKKLLIKKISKFDLQKFSKYLTKIGYRINYSKSFQIKQLTKVFQMRFRPEKVDGKLDLECFMIAKSLKNLS